MHAHDCQVIRQTIVSKSSRGYRRGKLLAVIDILGVYARRESHVAERHYHSKHQRDTRSEKEKQKKE